MYKLVYIKGISRYDTWKFASKQEQYNYFDSLVGVSINDYYPPHYTNTIKLEISQVDFNSVNYNYLLLSFNNKYYCYFIDSIEYINEDVYSINITMDTIQTYMFDIDFQQANITKKSIDRYINGTINRNYLRENISRGNFVVDRMELDESDFRYIIMFSNTNLNGLYNFQGISSQEKRDLDEDDNIISTITSNYDFIYIIPVLKNKSTLDSYKLNTVGFRGKNNNETLVSAWFLQDFYTKGFYDLTSMPGCTNMIISNNKALDSLFNIDYTFEAIQGGRIVFTSNILDGEEGQYDGAHEKLVAFRVPTNLLNITKDIYKYLPFNRNTSLNVLKNKRFVPQLIDENYIRVYFGEKSNYNQLSLFLINNDTFSNSGYRLDFHTLFDVLTGARNYWFSNLSNRFDRFLTLIVCNSNEGLVLKNQAWKDYISQNRANYTTGFQLQKDLNIMEFGARLANTGLSALSTAVGGSITSQFLSPSRALAHQVGSNVSAVGGGIVGSVSGIAGALIKQYEIDTNHRILKDNLEACPQETKQGNNFSNDLNVSANSFMYKVEMVNDIDSVAMEYENEGYSVNEVVYNSNILNYLNRYYYNIVQAKDIRFDLTVLSTNDIKNDIRTRIESGLRLWNKSHNTNILDNIIYDNVETNLVEE